jgi:PhnB protein
LVQDVFNAEVSSQHKSKDGRFVVHGSMVFKDVMLMMFDDSDLIKAGTRMPVTTYLVVDDVVEVRSKALKAGFEPIKSLFNLSEGTEHTFWGDFNATLKDPFGHLWVVGHPSKDADKEELKKHEEAWYAKFEMDTSGNCPK